MHVLPVSISASPFSIFHIRGTLTVSRLALTHALPTKNAIRAFCAYVRACAACPRVPARSDTCVAHENTCNNVERTCYTLCVAFVSTRACLHACMHVRTCVCI